MTSEMNEKERKMGEMKLCYEVLGKNPEGKKFLSKLYDQYICAPVADPNKDASHAFFREGQNDIIRRFVYAVNEYGSNL